MIAKFVTSCLVLIFSATALTAAPPEPATKFEATAAYGVPGIVLPPGSFSIGVVGHLGNRYIVHIEDQAGDVLATFLGIPSKTIGKLADGKVNWPSPAQGITYLKGWYFPSTLVSLEFVYPKADAVAIAQANNSSVAAIDPASDGLLAATPKDLSPKDLQIVTLWILTPTRVGANRGAGIEAKRYEPTLNSAATQVASSAPRSAPVSSAPPSNDHIASAVVPPTPLRKARPHVLPHTAGNLAWFYLAGAFSIAGAAGMRMTRSRNA